MCVCVSVFRWTNLWLSNIEIFTFIGTEITLNFDCRVQIQVYSKTGVYAYLFHKDPIKRSTLWCHLNIYVKTNFPSREKKSILIRLKFWYTCEYTDDFLSSFIFSLPHTHSHTLLSGPFLAIYFHLCFTLVVFDYLFKMISLGQIMCECGKPLYSLHT